MFIYKITFPNKKVYIGQTTEKSINIRISHHKTDAIVRQKDITEFSPAGSRIGNAIRKYGLENEWVEQIDTASTLEELNEKEIYYIGLYNSTDDRNGYNIQSGGENHKHSEETKIKIGLATKERWKNPEIAKRMLEGQRKTVEIAKSKKGEIRVERETIQCAICENEFEARPKQNRKCCSRKCAAKYASQVAAEKKKEKTAKENEAIRELVYEWCLNNKDIVLNCPMNKISTNLSVLLNITNIDDWRTLTKKVAETESRKAFLEHLKHYCENIC